MPDMEDNLVLIETGGFSMWPFLLPKEKVVVRKVSWDELSCGDIIIYRANNQLVCHRLVRKSKDNLFARGDNSSWRVELVKSRMLDGKVTAIIRNGKIVDLTCWRRRFLGCLIAKTGPGITWCLRAVRPYLKIFRRK